MVEAELLVDGLTLGVVTVVLVFVSIARSGTRIRRAVVLFVRGVLTGVNVVVATVSRRRIPTLR